MKYTLSLLLILSVAAGLTAQNRADSAKTQPPSPAAMAAFSKNADAYNIAPVSFNSRDNDFCAVNFMEAVVFASARSKPFFAAKTDEAEENRYVHIYTTQKNSKGKYLKPKKFMRDLTSRYNDGPVSFSRDYNTVYFSRNNYRKATLAKDGTYKLRMFEARLNINGFDTVAQFPFNSNEYNLVHPSISADGSTIYFASDMPGGQGGMDIYYSKKVNGAWTTPVNLGDKVNTAKDDMFPFVASNGTVYFASEGHEGMGGLDIYEVKIKDGHGVRVYNMGQPINSSADDFGYFLLSDRKTGYFNTNRKNGDDDIYTIDIVREVKRGKDATIIVKNKATGEPLAAAKIVVNGDTMVTSDKGEYSMMLDEEADYKLQLMKADYFSNEASLSAKDSPDDVFTKEVFLEKDPKIALVALVKDIKTNVLVDGVTITIKDLVSNQQLDKATTNSEGEYRKALPGKKIGDQLIYTITVEKDGYLAKTTTFNYTVTAPGDIKLNELVDLGIGKVEVGMDLAKMIDIKPIYFDLGKSTIRKDAAIELDKIVAIMNEYPNMSIELGSHTDCRSSAASNLKLSGARAKASADYIVKKGINKTRIVGKGYGESKLLNNCACEGKVVSNCSEEEHTKNRRTEFLITRLK